jgi:hypothetical protein
MLDLTPPRHVSTLPETSQADWVLTLELTGSCAGFK